MAASLCAAVQVADRFGLDRLKRLCELEMLSAISVDSAAHILYTADQHNAEVGARDVDSLVAIFLILQPLPYGPQNLRERCMGFVLVHFDEISRTAGFEEMGRTNVELGEWHETNCTYVQLFTMCVLLFSFRNFATKMRCMEKCHSRGIKRPRITFLAH